MAASLFSGGCAGLALHTSTEARVDSAEFPVRLEPRITTRVFTARDNNQADVYLTDLPPETFDDPAALSQASGQLIHVSMLFRPYPGRTPIERTACTAAVRYFVLAEGRVGVYSGGGFLFPRGKPDGDTFAASMPGGSVRLVARGPGFIDQVGSGDLEVSFRARRDEDTAQRLRRTADRLGLSADLIEESGEAFVPDVNAAPVDTGVEKNAPLEPTGPAGRPSSLPALPPPS